MINRDWFKTIKNPEGTPRPYPSGVQQVNQVRLGLSIELWK